MKKLIWTVCLFAAAPLWASGLLVADGGFGGQLELVDQKVKVTIRDGIVVTDLEQVFHNQERRIVEALYVFPVPHNASVANFSMWINGKEMVGEVLEKERAREIYQSYKRTRRDPGLLEQKDYKTFEMRVFPIPAGGDQRIRITYYQELDFDANWATYVYPLATTAVPNENSRVTGTFALDIEGFSEIPIVAMESPSHANEIVMTKRQANHFQASVEIPQGSLAKDFVFAYQVNRPHTGIDVIASCPRGEDPTFLLTLTPGEELQGDTQGMDYVFVMDISGSMNEDGKLDLSQNSVRAFVDSLSAQDRFEVLSFNISVKECFRQLQSGEATNKSEAFRFMNDLRSGGGTQLKPALDWAYRYKEDDRILNVVLLSDGMTEAGERDELLNLIRQRPNGSRVFCIGVGNEVNRPLLENLAEESGGLAAFISRGDNFERQAQAFRRKLLKPVATNVQIQFESVKVYDLEPAQIPNLFHGSPVRLYGRYRNGGETKVIVTATIGGREIRSETKITLPERDSEHPEIERMWAWHRIKTLEKANKTRDAIDEIIRLGEGYSIVTPYTSFLVLENDAEYKRWKIERRNATRIERDRSAQAALQARLDNLKKGEDLGPAPLEVQARNDRPLNIPTGPSMPQSNQSTVQPSSDHGNLDFGGGAIDPLTGLVGLGIAGWAARNRKRKKDNSPE
ncbi:MAG: VWA domain-containing protein [Acidobacteria bacterium]|nr:VWA domain-containing protein [Acidobacteriota bacterium]